MSEGSTGGKDSGGGAQADCPIVGHSEVKATKVKKQEEEAPTLPAQGLRPGVGSHF